MPIAIIALILGIIVLAVVLVIAGIRAPQASDPISSRLAEYSISEEAMTLEEIELSQRFTERVMLPIFNNIGMLASRFTPQATLETTRVKLIKAGNPMQIDPAFFIALLPMNEEETAAISSRYFSLDTILTLLLSFTSTTVILTSWLVEKPIVCSSLLMKSAFSIKN